MVGHDIAAERGKALHHLRIATFEATLATQALLLLLLRRLRLATNLLQILEACWTLAAQHVRREQS